MTDQRGLEYPGSLSGQRSSLSKPTLGRLPKYLRRLGFLESQGVEYVSSNDLARAAGVSRDVLRKDLSGLGQLGRRGKGYPVTQLEHAIELVMGVSESQPVVLVGAGNLGQALMSYQGFAARGLSVQAVLDADPRKIGTRCDELLIEDVQCLEEKVAELGVTLAILAVPAAAGQEVADRLVAAGVRAILSFVPTGVSVPAEVTLRAVDLSAELQILAFQERHNDPAAD